MEKVIEKVAVTIVYKEKYWHYVLDNVLWLELISLNQYIYDFKI